MSNPARIKQAAATFVPQSLDQVNEAIAELGRNQRERDRIAAEMNDNLAAVRTEYEAMAKPHGERITELHQGIAIWCEANRGELTRDGKIKTAKLAAGEIAWRTRPPSVIVRGGIANVIAALKLRKLTRMIRTKEEIDKEAVLKEPGIVDKIKGLSITQHEDFSVKPFNTELEEIR